MTVYDQYAQGAHGAYRGASYEESQHTYGAEGASPAAGAMTFMGGLASLVLIGGLAMWSYDLVLRDVAGVPVIRALDGPMRVQPENPGGSQADYQGLAVNQVQAAGVAADAPAQIILAPRPLDLSDATPPSLQLELLPDSVVAEATASVAPMTEAQVLQAVYQSETAPDPEAAPDPVRDTGLAVEALLTELVAEEEATADIVPTTVPGVARSLRPAARPAAEVRVASLTPDTVTLTAATPTAFVDPATLAPGTRMVQFRAYATEAEAYLAWDQLFAQFRDYMTGKSPVILPSSDGASTFYRLRMTGFADMAEAQRFCSVFLAANRDCVPVQF
ncbi:MAG: SPOR domain-containing protein [Dinoroseobacter sp.]|nr:SPOR domain-containing protein [Dinoroseobacter sp.]